MRQATLEQITDMLISRRRLDEEGWSSRTLVAAIEERRLHRVRRGWFIDLARWRELHPESQHRAEVVAAALASAGSDPVFSHVSAAVLWDLPLFRLRPERVHVMTRPDRRHSTPTLLRHEGALAVADVAEIGGIRCTSLARTVFDVIRTVGPEAAIALADAAFARVGGEPWAYDDEAAGRLLADLEVRMRAPGVRGIVQARRITGLADGRAQLPLESLTRYRLFQLGFARPRLQVPVRRADGGCFWMDIAVDQARTFVECDGNAKYVDEGMRGQRTTERVLLDEKAREDWVRGVSGWRVVRVRSEHVATLEAAASHFRAMGLFANRAPH